jgi:NAD(P)-dependent dehydrogenase (short-subunit alcohol dehydrogenase family)
MKKQNMKLTLLLVGLLIQPLESLAGQPESMYSDFRQSTQAETVIITGSNRGIGLAWVRYHLVEGRSVIATCRNPTDAAELIALRSRFGDRLLIEQLDVTDENSVDSLGARLEEHGLNIDIAISNAGVTVAEPFGSWTREGFEANFVVNTIGAALFAQMVAPRLNDGAMLVQTTSAVGSISRVKRDNPLDAYAVSKAGLNMLTRRLAIKLRERNILVVSVTPGRVLTDMNPNGIITADESVALMAAALGELSMEDSGSFINNVGTRFDW